ncbi:MAG: OmpA family protein [Patescibacteria group bacterium]|nr:OmpA family protein [Patescibacteria group bacterium]
MMNRKKKMKYLVVMVVMLFMVASCATTSHDQWSKQKKGAVWGTAGGAAAGAILGQVIGGDTKSTVLSAVAGAAVGGLAGHQIGGYMDQQEQALNNAFAASEAASVRRSRDVLIACFESDYMFDYDSAKLKPGAYTEISRVTRVLKQYGQTRLIIAGHTDREGSEAYNMDLSERRAESVAAALVNEGIPERRMTVIGYGESQPISSSDAVNRRVEIIIIPIEQQRG